MTILLAVLAGLVIAAIALTVHRQNQLDRRWRAERERRAAYDERLAVHNGRPEGDVVAIIPTSRPRGREQDRSGS
jgi:hypothetical protein